MFRHRRSGDGRVATTGRRPTPAEPRHTRPKLPLLPSGPDGVHLIALREDRCKPPKLNCIRASDFAKSALFRRRNRSGTSAYHTSTQRKNTPISGKRTGGNGIRLREYYCGTRNRNRSGAQLFLDIQGSGAAGFGKFPKYIVCHFVDYNFLEQGHLTKGYEFGRNRPGIEHGILTLPGASGAMWQAMNDRAR